MNNNWRTGVIRRLCFLGAGALLAGWLIGYPGWTLAAALGLYILWMLRQLFRLGQWLLSQAEVENEPPESRGFWGEIFDGIYHMQRRQQRTRDRLQGIIDRIQESTAALNDAVVMMDEDGNLDWWNRSAERLLGFSAPADRGHPITHLLRHPRFRKYFSACAYQEPLEMLSPIDETRWLQFSITLFGKGERLLVCRDVTRLHNLEEMRKDFVANVSHELRTPLTVIRGYLETLLDHAELVPGGERWKRALTQMQQQTERMGSLVSDLLLLSRLETDLQPSEPQNIALTPLLNHIVNDAKALSQGRHVISLELEPDSTLAGFETELHSAFSNLVFNAVKYSPGGQIRIRWWTDAHGGHLAVEDQGNGIDPKHIQRLTERFYRVDKGRSIQTGGTGLGLAIVKHVLLRHSAQLEIQSQLGKGSCFTCHFPMPQAQQKSA